VLPLTPLAFVPVSVRSIRRNAGASSAAKCLIRGPPLPLRSRRSAATSSCASTESDETHPERSGNDHALPLAAPTRGGPAAESGSRRRRSPRCRAPLPFLLLVLAGRVNRRQLEIVEFSRRSRRARARPDAGGPSPVDHALRGADHSLRGRCSATRRIGPLILLLVIRWRARAPRGRARRGRAGRVRERRARARWRRAGRRRARRGRAR